MELRITIFLAAVFVSLALNLAFFAYLYLHLSEASRKAEADRERVGSVLGKIRAAVEGAAEASSAAADWSGRARDAVREIEPKLLDLSGRLGYALAKIDFKVDAYSQKITADVQTLRKRATERVAGPVTEAITVIQGARALGNLVSLVASRDDDEAGEAPGSTTPFRPPNRKIL
jgi:hypothetical protein